MKTFLTFHENAYGYSFGAMKPVADLHAKFSQKDVNDIEKFADRILTVSYTHLTLPTSSWV